MSERLPVRTKLGFGVADLGGNLFFTAIGLWLMIYLTDTVGMLPAIAGVVVAVGKVWDGVTDPVVGYLSDRTRSLWGRRRPWLLFGVVPLWITTIIMFTSPGLDSQVALLIWGLLAFCALNTAYTAVNIPYNALTPELTRDYDERSSLNGYRFGFAVVGTLLGAAAAQPLIQAFESETTGYTVMGATFGGVMLVTALITFASVREPPLPQAPSRDPIVRTYLEVLRSKPFQRITATYALHITGLTVVMGVAPYYFKYVKQQEQMTTPAMVILLVTAFVFIPISVWVAGKVGKKLVYQLGMGAFGLALLALFAAGHLLPISFSLGVMVLAGMGMGFTYAMPWAMVPDAVEYDQLQSGKAREGAFYGVWTFAIKLGQAIALAISGAVLTVAGYVANSEQTADSLLGIRVLLGPIPAVILVLGIVVLAAYPITAAKYREIRAQLEQRSSG